MCDFQIDKDNFEQQQALDLITNTDTSLFITGKAGTGKTTFIKNILKDVDKNFLVLAPTGIAALAVGGQTIHSFFGFPCEVIGSNTQTEMSLAKRNLLKRTDTIIVDEASMVRADLVDGMDRVLRDITKSHLPFGGKQMVFVGDLFQLPPVVKRGSVDEEVLRLMYGSGLPYFYKARVMKRLNLPKIEFQHVYRQQDQPFLDILDRMRVGENTIEDLNILNKNVSSDDNVGDYSVTLTAFNKVAEQINNARLAEINEKEFCYDGEISGKFKAQDAPVPMALRLKVGAQVIFCRNDYSRGVINGTIAKVVSLDKETIKVALKNGKEINVEKMSWESKESVYNEEKQKVESKVVGTFTQYPLKLAWVITIHKSQGMTFDRMHFDLTHGTFAAGQAYVAISRMRSLDGLTLSNRLQQFHIIQNSEIKAFSNSFNDVAMIDDELTFGRMLYGYIRKKDYDGAVNLCLQKAVSKLRSGDYRNAALMAKKMFDIMLDDECLMGKTKDVPLLKDCSMTCNFLNAMLCLYSGRFDEAIGYVDLVLAVRHCLEAMFIKGSALYCLGRYEDAATVDQLIIDTSKKLEEKMPVDKKQYLFEMKLNEKLGRPNIDTCRKLVRLCPQYVDAYVIMRREAQESDVSVETSDDEDNTIINAFNDKMMSEEKFRKLLVENVSSATFWNFHKKAVNLLIDNSNKG